MENNIYNIGFADANGIIPVMLHGNIIKYFDNAAEAKRWILKQMNLQLTKNNFNGADQYMDSKQFDKDNALFAGEITAEYLKEHIAEISAYLMQFRGCEFKVSSTGAVMAYSPAYLRERARERGFDTICAEDVANILEAAKGPFAANAKMVEAHRAAKRLFSDIDKPTDSTGIFKNEIV